MTIVLLLLVSVLASASAFVRTVGPSGEIRVQPRRSLSSWKKSSSTTLSMALERQSPQVRKNVMAAAVSAAAMPALMSTLSAASAVIPAAVATQLVTTTVVPVDDWRITTAVFGAHWFVTNLLLQQFPDAGELVDKK